MFFQYGTEVGEKQRAEAESQRWAQQLESYHKKSRLGK